MDLTETSLEVGWPTVIMLEGADDQHLVNSTGLSRRVLSGSKKGHPWTCLFLVVGGKTGWID